MVNPTDSSAADVAREAPVKSGKATVLKILRGGVILACLGTIAAALVSIVMTSLEEASQAKANQKPRRSRPALESFELSETTIPRLEILAGGPPKDGIPALTEPRFVSAENARNFTSEERVMGLVVDGTARAYPVRILEQHEIVNDTLGNTPVAVTYCPLCDSAIVFDRRTPLGVKEFGVSGLLYNSNVLMFDRSEKRESLWSQMKREGVSADARNKSLKTLPFELVSWGEWKQRHPSSVVLSFETGHERNYRRSPYQDYFSSPEIMFRSEPQSAVLPKKERVLGVWSGETSRAYPESAFSAENAVVEDRIDGKKLTIQFNPDTKSLRVSKADPGVRWLYSFWFSWYAFHPETEIYSAK